MKSIFPKTIGTLRELGTARDWTGEIIGTALCAAVLILCLIFL